MLCSRYGHFTFFLKGLVLLVNFVSDLTRYVAQLLGILEFGVLLFAGALMNDSSSTEKQDFAPVVKYCL